MAVQKGGKAAKAAKGKPPKPPKAAAAAGEGKAKEAAAAGGEQQPAAAAAGGGAAVDVGQPNPKLFVENLPSATTAAMLEMLFQQFPGERPPALPASGRPCCAGTAPALFTSLSWGARLLLCSTNKGVRHGKPGAGAGSCDPCTQQAERTHPL